MPEETESIEGQAPEDPRFEALEQKIETGLDAMMQGVNELGRKFAEGMVAMDEKVNLALAQAQQPQAAAQAPSRPPEEVIRHVAEGTVRFFSPIKEYAVIVEHGGTTILNGRSVPLPFRKLEFHNGILDLNVERNAEDIELLRNLRNPDTGVAYLGTDYFEDPTAMPLPGPVITDGPRGTATARPEKPAELAVRA
jgi:hypothetical protein